LVRHRSAGFSLVEAIVALTISTVIVMLVSSTFLAQNRFYAQQLQRVSAHDNARTMTEMIAADLRSASAGSMIAAEPDWFIVRSPIGIAVVCGTSGPGRVSVHLEGGASLVDSEDFSGFAVRNDTTGAWRYHEWVTWGSIYQSGGNPAQDCLGEGADTVGARSEFMRLRNLNNYHSSTPQLGSLIMLYRSVHYHLQPSHVDPTTLGLFRGLYGDTIRELATGFDATARFQYRYDGRNYVNRVVGARIVDIDALRIYAQVRRNGGTGGMEDITYGWDVNVPFRNAR